MVGFGVVFQQTPLAVTEEPPSLTSIPPLEAEVVVIAVTGVVVRFALTTMVAKVISSP